MLMGALSVASTARGTAGPLAAGVDVLHRRGGGSRNARALGGGLAKRLRSGEAQLGSVMHSEPDEMISSAGRQPALCVVGEARYARRHGSLRRGHRRR
jgi:hypothetical protein